MTLRRLHVLISALPAEALLWHELEAARKRALIPTPEQIRARQAHYARQRAEAVDNG